VKPSIKERWTPFHQYACDVADFLLKNKTHTVLIHLMNDRMEWLIFFYNLFCFFHALGGEFFNFNVYVEFTTDTATAIIDEVFI